MESKKELCEWCGEEEVYIGVYEREKEVLICKSCYQEFYELD